MRIIDKLRSRQVSVEVLEREGKALREQWEEKFAGILSRKQKRKIYLDQHLWHLFSYEQVEHLSGREAEEAFDATLKKTCFVFYQRDDEALKLTDASALKAKVFEDENDIYIMDDRMTWTYVHTHEDDLGPYFYRKNRK